MIVSKQTIFVEVIEIYPNLTFKLPNKLKEQGTCHVRLRVGDLKMKIKNIRYQVRKNGGIWVGPPMNVYPDAERNAASQAIKRKKGVIPKSLNLSVPTIIFEDHIIFDQIKETIKKELIQSL